MEPRKYLLLFLVATLFTFYYWYFKLYLEARRRLSPWVKALKRIKS